MELILPTVLNFFKVSCSHLLFKIQFLFATHHWGYLRIRVAFLNISKRCLQFLELLYRSASHLKISLVLLLVFFRFPLRLF